MRREEIIASAVRELAAEQSSIRLNSQALPLPLPLPPLSHNSPARYPVYPYISPQTELKRSKLTSLLLLQRQLRPINLHPIPQRHPQIRLFLRRHRLPPLLDISQRWVRDRVCLSLLYLRAGGSYDRSEGGCAEHLDNFTS